MLKKKMEEKTEIAIVYLDEIEDFIQEGVRGREVAEGWLGSWDYMEYRISRKGRYEGAVLLKINYDKSGWDVELDTQRYEISIRDTMTEELFLTRMIIHQEMRKRIQAIDKMAEMEWEKKNGRIYENRRGL